MTDIGSITPKGSALMAGDRNLDIQTRSGINKHYLFTATAQNLTGSGITSVVTLDKNSSVHAGSGCTMYDTGGLTTDSTVENFSEVRGWDRQKFYTNQFAPRGWGSVLKTQFKNNGDYLLIDVGAASNWSTSTNDDELIFWLGGEQTAAGTILDLELIADDGTTSKSDHNVTAYAVAKEWQLIDIDTSGDTLDDVEFIKIQCDTATGNPIFYFSDFVRAHTNAVDNDAYYQVTAQTYLGCPATNLAVYLKNMAADEQAKIYVNSLANSPYVLFPDNWTYINSMPVHSFWINSVTSDTSVDYYVEAEGVYL